MRHRFQPAFITHFKLILIVIAVLFLCGSAHAEKDKPLQVKIVEKLDIPKWYHEGLYFDGKNIWVNNGEEGRTWVVDPSDGSVIKQLEPVGPFTEAITLKSKGIYFLTDWELKKVYTVRIDNDRMISQSEFSVEPAHPAGAVWTGKNLFVITWARSLTGTKFHILKMDDKFNITQKRKIDTIQEPSQIAWDGKSLWISSWYSRRVYKMDPENFKILGYFKTPMERATGITWDGKYLWLTGTNAGLYKMEVN